MAHSDPQQQQGGGVTVEVPDAGAERRRYAYAELPNQLGCLLVSDPETETAAAAMDCYVGQFQDFPEVQGLAHFTEHMMFLGTEKYPKENEYSEYLTKNGGRCNAYTAYENTNFMFCVNASCLEGALDRFAQFFIAPLFTETATERELMAIESEDQKNTSSDYMRFTMFLKDVANPAHPFSRFGNGNLQTLKVQPKEEGIDMREKLLAFQKYYSANTMKLCIYGKEPVERLRQMAEQHFGSIANKDIIPPARSVESLSLWDPAKLGRVYYVTAVKEDSRLHMFWDVTSSYSHWDTKPNRYWAHLLGHECEGSVLELLRKRGWAQELIAGGVLEVSSRTSIFEVEIYLTDQGLDKVLDVVDVVYDYIAMVKRHGFSEEVWKEVVSTSVMEFRFKEVNDPFGHSSSCASNLNKFPPAQAVSGDYMIPKKDPAAVMALGDELSPARCVLTVKRHSFDDGRCGVAVDRVTRYHDNKYGSSPVAAERLARWADPPSVAEGLAMPLVNPFIPDDFAVRPAPAGAPEVPQLAHLNAMPAHCLPQMSAPPEVELYHWHDTRYKVPKGYIRLQLTSALAYLSPRSRALTRIYVKLLKEATNTFTYYAEIANLSLDAQPSQDGLDILVAGINQKLPMLLKQTFDTIAEYREPDAEKFSMWHAKVKQELVNYTRSQAYSHASELTSLCCHLTRWSASDLLEIIDSVTRQDLINFIQSFLKNVKVSMLVCGNITREEAIELPGKLQEWFLGRVCGPMPNTMTPQYARIMKIPEGCDLMVPIKDHNPETPNSAVEMYFQIGMQSPRVIALVDVFSRLIENLFFATLRTKEQLGYIVYASVKKQELVEGLRLVVQSALVSPWYIYSRMRCFLDALDPHFEKLEQAEFDKVVRAEIEKREEKPKTLTKQGEVWYKAIESRAFNFNADADEIRALRLITIDDLRAFYNRHVSNRSPSRRTLVAMCAGKEHRGFVDELVEKWRGAGTPVLLPDSRALDTRRDLLAESGSGAAPAPVPAEVVDAIAEEGLPPEVMAALAQRGVTPGTVRESGIKDPELVRALCQMLGVDPPEDPAAPGAAGAAGDSALELGDGGGEPISVAWAMSFGVLKQCFETYPAWAPPGVFPAAEAGQN